MKVNNISTNYNSNQNKNQTPPRTSILKPLVYTYLTALAVIPVNTSDYFEKSDQLQETKEKIRKSPFSNESDEYLRERFSSKNNNPNIFYQLQMANTVDQAQMEKVSDDKFRYSIQVDTKKIKGKLKFVNEDKVIYGSATINDLSKEISKSKEFKFKIILPNKKTNTFLLKILDETSPEHKSIYKISRETDGRLVLDDEKGKTVLNPKNTEIYQAIRDLERQLSDEGREIDKAKSEQKSIQLILSLVFLFEFLTGMRKNETNQE